MESYLPIFIVIAFLIIFPLFWVSMVFLIGFVGGWRSLANQFPSAEPMSIKPIVRHSAISLKLGFGGNYRNIAEMDVYPNGIRLSTGALFKFGHPPIFIPKTAIGEAKLKKQLFTQALQIHVGNRKLTVYGDLCKAILQWYEGNAK